MVLGLIHEAGNPYFDWFFRSARRTAGTLAAWMERPSSEVSAERVTVVRAGTRLVGIFIALSGSELAVCRKADAFALLKEAGRDLGARAALTERLRAAQTLFGAVESGDYYLSKIGVVPAYRRQGLGRTIAREYLDVGRRSGFTRFRLDVSSDNEAALRIYYSLGFHVEHEQEAAGMQYVSMLLADASGEERLSKGTPTTRALGPKPAAEPTVRFPKTWASAFFCVCCTGVAQVLICRGFVGATVIDTATLL